MCIFNLPTRKMWGSLLGPEAGINQTSLQNILEPTLTIDFRGGHHGEPQAATATAIRISGKERSSLMP
jgi:hypothetical protein